MVQSARIFRMGSNQSAMSETNIAILPLDYRNTRADTGALNRGRSMQRKTVIKGHLYLPLNE